jgi:hypothetical protein
MDLEAAAGARATSMSLLWAGRSSWRTWAEDTALRDRRLRDRRERATASVRCTGSEKLQASRRGMCKAIALTNCCSFLSEAGNVTDRG